MYSCSVFFIKHKLVRNGPNIHYLPKVFLQMLSVFTKPAICKFLQPISDHKRLLYSNCLLGRPNRPLLLDDLGRFAPNPIIYRFYTTIRHKQQYIMRLRSEIRKMRIGRSTSVTSAEWAKKFRNLCTEYISDRTLL